MSPAPPGRRAGLSSPWVALWAMAAVGWAGAIFWFSSHTGSELPRHWLLSHDKLCHAGEYALLGALICGALLTGGARTWRAVIVASLLAGAYGLTDEYHQGFVAGRQGNDPLDAAADLAGGTVGAVSLALGRLRLRPAVPSTSQEIPA